MSQEPHIQHLLDRATKSLPVTIEHEVLGSKRILFKMTHADGRTALVGSDRPVLFRLEYCMDTVTALFREAANVRWPSNL